MIVEEQELEKESIIRFCYSPTFWDEQKNKPKAAAFADAFKERGMSVLVQSLITQDQLNYRRQQILKAGRERCSDIIAKVSEVVSLKDIDGEQIFEVVSSPKKIQVVKRMQIFVQKSFIANLMSVNIGLY